MRVRYITYKTDKPYSRDIGKQILATLLFPAVGYDYREWPRIKVTYMSDC